MCACVTWHTAQHPQPVAPRWQVEPTLLLGMLLLLRWGRWRRWRRWHASAGTLQRHWLEPLLPQAMDQPAAVDDVARGGGGGGGGPGFAAAGRFLFVAEPPPPPPPAVQPWLACAMAVAPTVAAACLALQLLLLELWFRRHVL
jgi:hypothetical protein